MTPAEIITSLSHLGISVHVRGNNLIVSPKRNLPPFLAGEIRQHKSALMCLLMQPLVGCDIAVGFYKPNGKGQPKLPINGRGTTVLEADGLCSDDCAHEFCPADDTEVASESRFTNVKEFMRVVGC
jgi:hypothetical protein